jgi:nucleoside-diphosphate-sugar epimerase
MIEDEPVQLFGDGTQSRGFTYLDDIARGTIAALKPLGFEIFNLGGHEVISMNALITLLERITGRKARVNHLPANPGELLTSHANVEKAQRLLGWEPKVGLEAGVNNLVEWYLSERGWASEVSTQ